LPHAIQTPCQPVGLIIRSTETEECLKYENILIDSLSLSLSLSFSLSPSVTHTHTHTHTHTIEYSTTYQYVMNSISLQIMFFNSYTVLSIWIYSNLLLSALIMEETFY
jgi:hypothetical protein